MRSFGASFGPSFGASFGSDTPTPPAPVVGQPTFGSLGQAPYVDVRRWTKRGDAIKVRARAAPRSPQLRNAARVRQFQPASQYVAAQPVSPMPWLEPRRCAVRVLVIRTAGISAGRKAMPDSGPAKARTTERQDVMDILTIMELLEDQFDD